MRERVTLSRCDGVLVVRLGDDPQDENRLDPALLAGLDAALDAVSQQSAKALVTIGSERFYCNGYDLDGLAALDREARKDFIRATQRLLARILVLGVPTVAALSGHAFGAGALLALAHDRRVARSEHGFFCLPEIDARIPLRRGMTALVQARLSPRVARDALLTGRRYTGDEAVAAGIAEVATSGSGLLDAACEEASRGGGLAADERAARKQALYGSVEALLVGATGVSPGAQGSRDRVSHPSR